MRIPGLLTAAVFVAGTLGGAPAFAANVCKAEHMSCATTMPVGGFCQCAAKGTTEDGTVVPPGQVRGKLNASGAGCGTDTKAPGCR
jgi:hypothetical protein